MNNSSRNSKETSERNINFGLTDAEYKYGQTKLQDKKEKKKKILLKTVNGLEAWMKQQRSTFSIGLHRQSLA
jgi:hypothetical protein